MSRRSEGDKENLSNRQARKEEMRRRERQQRYFITGSLVVILVVVLAFVIVPLVQNALNPGGDFIEVTPQAYANAKGKTIGDPNAKIKIEVFEDFKCSACKTYAQNVEPDLIKQITDRADIYYVFYNFPFLDDQSADKQSDRAANAAMCAVEQERFWDYKAILFANQGAEANSTFSTERLKAFASSLGLDTDAFAACLAENRYQDVIDEELALGDQMGVSGTPSVFVNGKDVTPGRVPSVQEIMQAVADAQAAP